MLQIGWLLVLSITDLSYFYPPLKNDLLVGINMKFKRKICFSLNEVLIMATINVGKQVSKWIFLLGRQGNNMVEMTTDMQQCFDSMNDEQKIRMFYELTKYMHENMEYGEDEDMNNLIDDIANVKSDIENL